MEIGISTASFYPTLLEDALEQLVTRQVPVVELFLNTFSELNPELRQTVRACWIGVVPVPFRCIPLPVCWNHLCFLPAIPGDLRMGWSCTAAILITLPRWERKFWYFTAITGTPAVRRSVTMNGLPGYGRWRRKWELSWPRKMSLRIAAKIYPFWWRCAVT